MITGHGLNSLCLRPFASATSFAADVAKNSICELCLCFVFLHRKCKLTTTGPWQEIPPIALSDVTILPCTAQSNVDEVPLWAISNKGDVLCRLGVTALTPAVSHICCTRSDTPQTA